MPSRLARFVECIFRILHVKNNRLIKRIEKLQFRHMPIRFLFRFGNERIKIRKRSLITLCTRSKKKSDLHIIFLHGGAYTQQAYYPHWKLMGNFVSELKCKVTFVDYPLTPKYTFHDVYAMLTESYDYLVSHYGNDRFVFMGDSAGGGLALAFLQTLRDSSLKMPYKTVLYSPWLDLSMTNPDISKTETLDWMLAVDSLIEEAKNYAGGESLTNPLLSPIYGDLNHLSDVSVFYGTHEVFVADCRKLRALTLESGSRFSFHEYPGMQHDFILFPIPEASKAFDETVVFLQSAQTIV